MRLPRMRILLPMSLALVLAAGSSLGAAATALIAQAGGQAAALPVTKAVRFGRLVTGDGTVLTNALVVIEGDRIKSVGLSGASIPVNAEVIDLSRFTGVPGLIDMHTHLAGTSGDPRGPTGGVGQAPNQVLLRPPVVDAYSGPS